METEEAGDCEAEGCSEYPASDDEVSDADADVFAGEDSDEDWVSRNHDEE